MDDPKKVPEPMSSKKKKRNVYELNIIHSLTEQFQKPVDGISLRKKFLKIPHMKTREPAISKGIFVYLWSETRRWLQYYNNKDPSINLTVLKILF